LTTSIVTVAIAGVAGKMGREAALALQADSRFQVVGGLVRRAGQAPKDFEFPLYDDAQRLIHEVRPTVWLDLTDVNSVVSNIELALSEGVRPVVGATGYTTSDIKRWASVCLQQRIGAIVASNFAIGALLMIKFATEAARFMPNVEIIEMHHDGKKDAPSGTAKRTAQSMALPDIPIHSVRLPGLVAHQAVIFGGTGETLTIRHDSISRTSFMPGLLHACASVTSLEALVDGLEHILW